MTTRKFLLFNIGFWLVAAIVLFINAWPIGRDHLDVAIFRYFYLIIVALLITSSLILVYKSDSFQRKKQRLVRVAFFSIASALLTALIVNPITYMMSGVNIHTVPYEIWSTGTLYFALFYFAWSMLYFQISGRSLFHAVPAMVESDATSQSNGLVFRVEKAGEQRMLQDRDICYINASGDYVELVTAANTYLKKETLARLERQLNGERFKRIHRSIIVNADKIEAVVPKQGGSYELTLEGEHVVQSSRSYKTVVESILPKG